MDGWLPVLYLTQPGLGRFELVALHEPGHEADRQNWPAPDDVGGELVDPSADDRLPAFALHGGKGRLGDVCGTVDIPGGLGLTRLQRESRSWPSSVA